MKLLLINRSMLLACLFLVFVSMGTVSHGQPDNTQQSQTGFKVFSFNSKIPLASLPAARFADVVWLNTDGQWSNVRLNGGVPMWLSANDVIVLPDNTVRLLKEKAKAYIEPKNNSRYLMTLSKGFVSPILGIQGGWYQASTPSYLTVKMLASDYQRLVKQRQSRPAPLVSHTDSKTVSTQVETNTAVASVANLSETVASIPSRSAYLLTPGDVVSISVFGEPDMVLSNQRIGENGFVSFPLIGQIVIKGKTTQQVERMIESMLAKGYLRDPKVNVVINAYRPLYVRGAVNAPGSYEFTEGLTVAKVLTLAGGVAKGAITDTLKLYRDDELFLQNLTIDSQTLIQPGDILTVEEGVGAVEKASSFIYLHGEVNSPGGYEYRAGLTVEKAVALAGGFSPRASRKKIDITRENPDQETPDKIKRVKLFFDLKPGDVIHVGESWF